MQISSLNYPTHVIHYYFHNRTTSETQSRGYKFTEISFEKNIYKYFCKINNDFFFLKITFKMN